MSDSQFNQYLNLHKFAAKWRGYKQVSIPLKKDIFRKNMQFNDYVQLEYIHKNGKPVLIYLLSKNGKYSNSSQDIKRLLAKTREPTDVILVSAAPFKVYTKKAIVTFKHLRVKTYIHENFNLEVPKGALCYPHEIMSTEEVNNLLNNELYCSLVSLPKILIEDVQCIWTGAELGDVIRIKMISDITGTCYQYRVVVAKSGRVISFRNDDEPVEEIVDDEDDEEIQAHREAANEDNYDEGED
jgi:DNA-directed RNA polymerase subunit H (RpoH/RPB5)